MTKVIPFPEPAVPREQRLATSARAYLQVELALMDPWRNSTLIACLVVERDPDVREQLIRELGGK